ncbi:MAG: hypothetical protein ACRBB4_01235 [Neptuniibacter sp.]
MKQNSVKGVSGNLAFTYYFILKAFPFLVSSFALYLGYDLYVLGVTGEASLIINAKTTSGQLLNAAPGLFFALGGLFGLLLATHKGVKIDLGNQNESEGVEHIESSKEHDAGCSKENDEQGLNNFEKRLCELRDELKEMPAERKDELRNGLITRQTKFKNVQKKQLKQPCA